MRFLKKVFQSINKSIAIQIEPDRAKDRAGWEVVGNLLVVQYQSTKFFCHTLYFSILFIRISGALHMPSHLTWAKRPWTRYYCSCFTVRQNEPETGERACPGSFVRSRTRICTHVFTSLLLYPWMYPLQITLLKSRNGIFTSFSWTTGEYFWPQGAKHHKRNALSSSFPRRTTAKRVDTSFPSKHR